MRERDEDGSPVGKHGGGTKDAREVNADVDSPPNSAMEGNGAEPVHEGEGGTDLAEIVAERDRVRDQLLRTAADFDNFRKRTKKDLEDAQRRVREDTLRDILPVIDNLERAISAAQSASDSQAVLDGVRMVLKLFEDVSANMGLGRVKSVGERFDPTVHEAVQQKETDSHPAGTIIGEVVPGYRFQNRLLRPAMVVVACPPSAPKGEAENAKA